MNASERKFATSEVRPNCRIAPVGDTNHAARLAFWAALVLALPCGLVYGQSQSQQSGTGQLSDHPLRYETGNMVPSLSESTRGQVDPERRMRQLVAAKHKSIVSNTDKLLKLITELNAEIGSTNPASLTPDQLRKVAAIEKLARSVKDEMRTPVEVPPDLIDPSKPLDGTPSRR